MFRGWNFPFNRVKLIIHVFFFVGIYSVSLHWFSSMDDYTEKLYFIDFEYGSYSYRGFDIGNHFNEYAGYDCDYSLYVISNLYASVWCYIKQGYKQRLFFCRYPNKEEQCHFFRHYLNPERPEEVWVSSKSIKLI